MTEQVAGKADRLRTILYSHDPFLGGSRSEQPQGVPSIDHRGKSSLDVRAEIGWDEFTSSIENPRLRPTLLAVNDEDVVIDDHLSSDPDIEDWGVDYDLQELKNSLSTPTDQELRMANPADDEDEFRTSKGVQRLWEKAVRALTSMRNLRLAGSRRSDRNIAGEETEDFERHFDRRIGLDPTGRRLKYEAAKIEPIDAEQND